MVIKRDPRVVAARRNKSIRTGKASYQVRVTETLACETFIAKGLYIAGRLPHVLASIGVVIIAILSRFTALRTICVIAQDKIYHQLR